MRAQHREQDAADRALTQVPQVIHVARHKHNTRAERLSKVACNHMCLNGLREMAEHKKQNHLCVSLAEKTAREDLFRLREELTKLEFECEIKVAENQEKMKNCAKKSDGECLEALVESAKNQKKEGHRDVGHVIESAKNIGPKFKTEAEMCLNDLMNGTKAAGAKCPGQPDQAEVLTEAAAPAKEQESGSGPGLEEQPEPTEPTEPTETHVVEEEAGPVE